MKLQSQKKGSVTHSLIITLFIFNCVIISTAAADNEQANDNVDPFDSKISQRFFDHVNKVVNGGRLKKIWDKFLKNGISETDLEDAQSFKKKTSTDSQLLAQMSEIGLKISKELKENSTDNRLIKSQAPTKLCPFLQNKKCDPNEIFRSIDGSCNNLEFPLLGKASTPYKRYLPPAYGDGLETARSKGKSGKDLPSPRVVSLKLFKDNFQFDNEYTHIIAFFGQFITHDFTMASVSAGIKFLLVIN